MHKSQGKRRKEGDTTVAGIGAQDIATANAVFVPYANARLHHSNPRNNPGAVVIELPIGRTVI